MHAFSRWTGWRISLFAIAGAMLITLSAWACQVPVFRYALERWPADKYELLIVHKGPLNDSSISQLEWLKAMQLPDIAVAPKTTDAVEGSAAAAESTATKTGFANFETRTVDISDPTAAADETLLAAWEKHSQDGKPVMVLLYPQNAREVPDRLVAAMPLSDEAITTLADSPVRKKLREEILSGESAVWIFVPCGDSERDAAAYKILADQVKENEEQLELPPQEEIEADEFYQPNVNIELRLGFSIVKLERGDEKEQWMLRQLLGSESDLETVDDPLAFPVLGRGRVLYALVGKGIMPETIGIASRFVVGPCSCQVKEQNPGFDLLMSEDWGKAVGSQTLSDPLPEVSAEPVLLSIPPGRSSR